MFDPVTLSSAAANQGVFSGPVCVFAVETNVQELRQKTG